MYLILFFLALPISHMAYGQQGGVEIASSPLVIRAVAPLYPTLAFQSRTSGRVTVEIALGPSGIVGHARAIAGDHLFLDLSERAAMRWKFDTSTVPLRTVGLVFVFTILQGRPEPENLTAVFSPPYEIEVKRETAEPNVILDPRGFSTKSAGQPKKQIR